MSICLTEKLKKFFLNFNLKLQITKSKQLLLTKNVWIFEFQVRCIENVIVTLYHVSMVFKEKHAVVVTLSKTII